MNRVRRSMLTGLVIVLFLSLFVMGCDPCSQCMLLCMDGQTDFEVCYMACAFYAGCRPPSWLAGTDNPEEFQLYCEEHPEECSWIEADE